MNLHGLARARIERGESPVRVGLIGAGKFGSMFLNQVPTSPLEVTSIADLDPERARAACRTVGWEDERIDRVEFVEDGKELCARDDVDVVLEVTGSPPAGIAHARDPLRMAGAMKSATEAGRLAYLAGRIPKKLYATASSPMEGTVSPAKPR